MNDQESQNNLPAVRAQSAPVMLMSGALSVEECARQIAHIQEHMKSSMKPDLHYGKIEGCGDKPSLLKPGAEKLCFIFNMAPTFEIKEVPMPHPTVQGHVKYIIKCRLSHRGTGQIIAEGDGVCTTMESKYRFRKAERKCPNCGKEAIIKGKPEYGGGWLCWPKKEGCNTKWPDGAAEIEQQIVGKVEYDNPADYYNTCTKMGAKRAIVAATLFGTAASDIFGQDLEDMRDIIEAEFERRPVPEGQPAAAQQQPAPAANQKAAPRQQRPRPAANPPEQRREKTWEEMTEAEQEAARAAAAGQAAPSAAKDYRLKTNPKPNYAGAVVDHTAVAAAAANPLRNPYAHVVEGVPGVELKARGRALADIPISDLRRVLRDQRLRAMLSPADIANMELIDRTEAAGGIAGAQPPAQEGPPASAYDDPDGHYPG